MGLPLNLPTEERNIFCKKVVSLAMGVHHDNNALLFWNSTKFLCLAYDSFGQSEVQVKKSLKFFRLLFIYTLFCHVHEGSNCVNPISARWKFINFKTKVWRQSAGKFTFKHPLFKCSMDFRHDYSLKTGFMWVNRSTSVQK